MSYICYLCHTYGLKRSVSMMVMGLLIVLLISSCRITAMESEQTASKSIKSQEEIKLQEAKTLADKQVAQAKEELARVQEIKTSEQTDVQKAQTAASIRDAEFKLRRALLKQEDVTKNLAETATAKDKAIAEQELKQIQKERTALEQSLQQAEPVWTKTSFTGPNFSKAIDTMMDAYKTQKMGDLLIDAVLTPEPIPVAQKRASIISRFVDFFRSIFGIGKPSIIAAEAPTLADKLAIYEQSKSLVEPNIAEARAQLKAAASKIATQDSGLLRQKLLSGQEALKQAKNILTNPEKFTQELVNRTYEETYGKPNPYAVFNVPANTPLEELTKLYTLKTAKLSEGSLERKQLGDAYLTLSLQGTRLTLDNNLGEIRNQVKSLLPADFSPIREQVSDYFNQVIAGLET